MKKYVLLCLMAVISILFCQSFTDIGAGLTGVYSASTDWGDYDNDGDLDILLTGWTMWGEISNIYRNDGGSFTNINAGLPGINYGSAAWGDYDNDGDLDIVLTGISGSGNIMNIYRNDGGTFTDINAGLPGLRYSNVAWGDYDNDGDLDIALTGTDGSWVSFSIIYRNDEGVFTNINAGLPGLEFGSVAWGDFDNDSDLDLLLTGSYTAKIYRNDTGTFTDINAGLTGVSYTSTAWGDYDNDGDLDILITGFPQGMATSYIYRNDSNGIFTNINAGLTGVYMSTGVWGDCDNDGDLDLLLTGYTGSSNISKIYRNEGNDSFADINAGLPGVYLRSAAWGDYDNDGDLDFLLTGEIGPGNYISTVYRNNSAVANTAPNAPANLSASVTGYDAKLTWRRAADIQTPKNGLSYNIYIGSSSGICNEQTPMSKISTGYRKVAKSGNTQQDSTWTVKGLPTGRYYWSVQAVDNTFAGSAFSTESSFVTAPGGTVAIEADNILLTGFSANWQANDLATGYKIDVDDNSDFSSPLAGYNNLDVGNVLTCAVTGLTQETEYFYRLRAYNASGTGAAGNTVSVSTLSGFTDINAGLTGLAYSDAAWGDYDNDGDLDILLTGYNGSYNSIIYRNESGIFTDINAGLTGLIYSSAEWGDYDNDGDLDILITGWAGSGCITKIYQNNLGIFSDMNAGLQGVYFGDCKWGDFDNDGDLDIVVIGNNGSIYISRVYRNDSGVFTDINAAMTGVGESKVSCADYDSDGDLDVLIIGWSGSGCSTKIYQNNSGIFTEINDGLADLMYATADWGDFDNDGDQDILVAGSWNPGYLTAVYRNDSGVFTDINAGLTGLSNSSAVWGDYDNDGDLDILLTGYNGSINSIIYRNDSGLFTDMNAGLPGLYSGSAGWGDYDNDGDLDILITGYDPAYHNISKIYRNNSETPNTPPSKPSRLITSLAGDVLSFSFNPATDTQTPQNGLNYNIDIIVNGNSIKSGMSDLTSGFRKIVSTGNISQKKSWSLKNFTSALPQSKKILSWKVQAVDNCFAGSQFASSPEFDFSGRDLEVYSKTDMIGTDFLKWEYAYPEYVDHYVLQIDDDSVFGSPIEENITLEKSSTEKDSKTMYLTKVLNTLTGYASLENNTEYFWRIKPVYSGNNESVFNSTPLSFIFNPGNIAPNPPVSGFNPANDDIESNLPKLSWNNAIDPDGHAEDLYYICQLDTVSTFTTMQYADTTAAGITSVQVGSALPEGYRYYYRVKTIDADALQSVWSAYQTFLVVMPPQDVKITDDGTNVNLTWDAIPVNTKGVVYTVYSSTNPYAEFPTGWTVAAAQLTANSWAEPHSAAKKFYRITAGSSSK